jgi:hypothetical protein
MQTMGQIIETFLKNSPFVKDCDFDDRIRSACFDFIGKNIEHKMMINWSDFNESSAAFISITSCTSLIVPFEDRSKILEFLNYTNSGDKRISRFILLPSGYLFCVSTIYANTEKIQDESVLKAIFVDSLYYEDSCHPIIEKMINSDLTLEEAKSEFQSQIE